MKVHARVLGNMAYSALAAAVDGDLGSANYGRLSGKRGYEFQLFDEAAFAIEVKRLLAAGKRRIVLDIDYRESE